MTGRIKSTLRKRPNKDGSVRWYLDLGDGGEWIPCPDVTTDDRVAAGKWRDTYVATMKRLGVTTRKTAEPTAETVDQWFDRWLRSREGRLADTVNDWGRYRKWVKPSIGHLAMKDVSKLDLERIVEALDRAVLEEETIEGSTAGKIWGVVSKMFSDACGSKILALRVRQDNPARDVAKPDRGNERQGPYLYPAEVVALMKCERIPVRWKRLIAFAIWTMMRRGELAALEWSAIDVTRKRISVHQAAHRETGKTKATKTDSNHHVGIEASLLPMLAEMADGADTLKGRVFPAMPPAEEMASRLRTYVEWACADARIPFRAEINADDETRRPLRWHDLRGTSATWRAIRGDDSLKVQRAGGWSSPKMLERYVREAESFESREVFGEVFPTLPLGAVGALYNEGTVSRTVYPSTGPSSGKDSGILASPTGFEPVLAA